MTDSPVFDPVLVGSQSSVTQSPAQGTGLVAAPQGDTDMIALGGLTPLPALAGEAPLGNTREDHGITCQIPSPGTLLLGALGAFLVGALRMRRML